MNTFIALTFCCMLLMYAVFLKSFFPTTKMVSDGFAVHSEYEVSDAINMFNVSASRMVNKNLPTYQKLVLLLVDALRADFAFGNLHGRGSSHMSFVNELMREGKAMSFIAKVHPPTVTLPRIKAITTGSIPGFVDVMLNFGSSILQEDNIMTQMWHAGRKIVMYGDDTWLRLFPGHFVRSDGTTSFFVTDYTEVDNNVTRHLPMELERLDFDVMVLHYLGLDHIGHVAGPKSSLIPPKLNEMDNIVKQIFQALQQSPEKSLVVLCGDHGMSDQGGHGGASPSETRVPVIFISPSLNVEPAILGSEDIPEIQQIDLASTLSMLLGLPIPKNNLGLVAIKALQDFNVEQKTMALRINALQILNVLEKNSPNLQNEEGYLLFKRASKSHADWLKHHPDNKKDADWLMQGKRISKEYVNAVVAMTKEISSSLTEYDIYGLLISTATLWMIAVAVILSFMEIKPVTVRSYVSMFLCCISAVLFCHVTICTARLCQNSLLCKTDFPFLLIQILSLVVFCIYLVRILVYLYIFMKDQKNYLHFDEKWKKFTLLFICGTAMHTFSLLSSSFVEEEHQTWYFYTVLMHLIILWQVLLPFVKVLDHKQNENYTSFKTDHHCTSDDVDEKLFCELQQGSCIKSSKENNDEFCKTPASKEDVRYKGDNSGFIQPLGDGKQISAVVVVLVLCRLLRTWNQTGNKWLDLPDVGDWLVSPDNRPILSLLVLISLVIVVSMKWGKQSSIQRGLFITGTCCIYWFRAQMGNLQLFGDVISKGITPARCVYILVFLYISHPLMTEAVGRIIQRAPRSNISGSLTLDIAVSVHTGWVLLMLLLVKAYNIPVVMMIVLQQQLMEVYVMPYVGMPVMMLTLYHLWMGMAAFFYQGNSNSMSTVDISAGYIGLEDYQPFIIGILLTLSTYAGPIFWLISLVKAIIVFYCVKDSVFNKQQLVKTLTLACHTLCISRALPLAVYTVLVTVERYHLFVWTVFSPKLLYEGMWTVIVSAFSILILALGNIR